MLLGGLLKALIFVPVFLFVYLQSSQVKEILEEQEESGRFIGAICAGKNLTFSLHSKLF